MINKQSYQITGMRQDNLVGTGFSSKFAHEIMNLRLNTVGDYTTAAWTTEEGTLLKSVEWINAPSDALALLVDNDTEVNPIIPIGQAIINDQWVVFATQNLTDDNPTRTGYDFIFLYWYNNGSDRLQGTILYAGNLNFDAKHPCETLTFYENEDIQKVYWTDGKNQPRVINIANVKYPTNLDGQFDFVQEVELKEKVSITKQTSGAGLFPPGTVKYAITYYKKYGQETNIVYDSPLYYPIKGERGCSPDELSGDSFEIKVTNLDVNHGFDYIRLYSIVRTTENATPIVRIVADKELKSLPTLDPTDPDYNPNNDLRYALFVDTNTTGEIVDPTVLQYVGGKEIIAQTFDQKNNTFFLGNIELTQKSALEVLKEVKLYPETAKFVIGDWFTMARIYDTGGYNKQHADRTSFAYDNEKAIGIRVNTNNSDKSFYQYSNQMTETNHWHSYAGYDANNNLLDGATNVRKHNGNSRKIKIFKYNEYYRFGIQFQDTKGNWSEVIYLTDCKNNIKPVTDEYSSVGIFGILKYTLPNNVVTALLANDYVKARLVCCYPTNADRNILAQGIVNPTMYNNFWKDSHAPDYFSSWFFRPVDLHDLNALDLNSVTFRQGGNTATSNMGNCEVQSCRYKNDGIFKQYFFTNQNVLTLHSAEIELDENIRTLNLDKVDIRTIGYVPVHSWATSVYVEATAPFPDYFANIGPGLTNAADIMSLNTGTAHSGAHFINQGEWKDRNYYGWWKGSLGSTTAFPLYPFHRKGSLANYIKDINPFYVSIPDSPSLFDWDDTDVVEYYVSSGAILQSKVFSNLIFSANTIFTDTTETLSTSHDQTKYDIKLNIFDSNESIPERLDNSLIYYGNLDTIAPVCDDLVRGVIKDNADPTPNETKIGGSYPLYAWNTRTEGTIDNLNGNFWASDPVPITYNSTPHGVFLTDFGDEQGERNYLNVSGSNISPYLYLVDIYKKVDDETRFGGKANTTNIYLPCGPVVDLRECQNSSPVLIGLEGDHYFMRYDCLKTYPRATDDVNQIVEILSFMTETRINLDGRYDKNRGLSDNTTITNTNFNLVNKSYTQSDNFFTYTTLDEDISTLNKFGNLITWSKDKISGEDVDTWTNITMVNTADAEGVCGQINKIINVNDTLYSFQDHGIAQIGYNEKTALSTEAGIPLEIANSGKYSGLKYITKEIGCQNKWSISSTKNGAFFIDDSRQELLTLSQELTSLSTINGFDAFLIQQLPDSEHFTPWTPYNPNNFVSYYDRLGNDVYYINKDYCLAWNEQSKTFTSFYSYNDIPLMANIGTHLLMWDNHSSFTFDLNSQEVSEEVTSYTRTTTTTTTEVEHTTTTTDTVVIPENIYTNESKRVLTFYHYIAGTERNNVVPALYNSETNGSIQYSFRDAQDHVKTSWKPATWFQSNTAANIKDSWARMVVQPRTYNSGNNYTWNAHFVLSLEFRKNGLPFIIQFEVEGIHYYNLNVTENRWQLSPSKPTIKIRTLNVTDEEFEKIKFFLGGWNQPTFNVGNIYHYLSYYRKVLDDVQPWNNIDDSFVTTIDGKERDVACIVKLYDLNMTTIPEQNDPIENYTDNYIIAWEFQGNPFRQQDQDDNSASVSTDDYTTEEIRYSNVTTTTETIETQTTTWEPTTETVKTTHYTVNNDSSSTRSNIWAARELVDANGRTICSNFFGNYKPYWMTIVCDGITQEGNAFPADKVFNNIEFRADVFDRLTNMPRVNINLPVFDKKAAYNGYQMYKEFPLDGIRKFNTWRVQLPRATYDINGTLTTTRDRIRNPFCYIKLKQTNTNPETTSGSIISDRMVLHDLAVYYDMK